MNCMQVSLVVFGLILVVGVQSGLSVKCFQCNSAYEGDVCLDPFDTERAKEFLIDCDKQTEEYGANFTYCRKMSQDVEGDFRLIRQCAANVRVEKLGKGVERTGTKDIKLKYWDCEGAGCNSAPAVFTLKVALLFVVSSLLAMIFQS